MKTAALSHAEGAADKIRLWREKPQVFVREVLGVTPDAWQDEVLAAFPHRQRLAMKACKGPGKAQPKDMMIPTPDGLKRFGDLAPGSRVFAGDGSITTVKAVHDRGVRPVYRVSFDDGSSTMACGEHLWKVRGRTERRHFGMRQSRSWTPQREARSRAQGWPTTALDGYAVLSTEQIIERGVRNKNGRWSGRQFEIPRQGAAQFPARRLRLDPYVLGIWLGDGIRKTGRYATKPTAEIQQEINARGYETSSEHDGIVTVYGILERLRELGVLDFYSHERYVPQQYLTASIPDRMDVLCGLMDTDGGIDADGHMQFATTSQRLANDMIWLTRSLGGTAHPVKTKKPFYYGKDREKIDGRDCYRVVIRLPFNPFRVPELKARWKDPALSQERLRYMTRYIDRIEPAGEADCMCIEVDHASSLYLTNDFIVTHNTAVEAWLGWNFLLTRPQPKIAATSISSDNLADNLWAEMAKWRQRSPLLRQTFEWTKSRIFAREYPETWWMSARSWTRSADSQTQGQALAGLHADYILFILDESGGIPDAVMAAAEAALASCVEGHIVQAGNPTHLEGPLWRACTSERALWHLTEITADPDDPKRTPRVKAEWAREQIQKYGRDSPWVLVNVFGRFPPGSLNALIGPDEIADAMERQYESATYADAARVLGVDVARFGDDASVIFPRQGLKAFPPVRLRNLDGPQGAGAVARTWRDWEADAVFIDDTGGFGAAWIDNLRLLGRSPIGVGFAQSANDAAKYANKRAEMYFEAVEWIKAGGALPGRNTPGLAELAAALTQTTYSFRGDQLLLEPKEQVKAKLGYSPDDADAFALTFAQPVLKHWTRAVDLSRLRRGIV